MSYNLLSGSVNFEGSGQGTIEDIVDTHSTQSITGAKTFTTVTASHTHTTRLQVGGTHATNHAVNVNGAISGSGNISGSAFYANGVLVSGGSITGVTAGADNRIATFSSATALNGEQNLTFDGTVLDFKATSISGSGNISGSQFYGSWAGTNIFGSQIQKASAGGIGDSSGLTLTTSGVPVQNTPNGSVTLFIDDSGTIKKSTITQLLTNQNVTSADGLGQGQARILLDGGVGTIASNANLNFFGTTLSVTGAMSASSDLDVGGTLDVRGNSVFKGDVEIHGTLTGGSPLEVSGGLNVTGAVNFASSSLNTSGSWIHTGSFYQSGSGNTFSILDIVGIGTTSPTATLEILSSSNPQFKITHNGTKHASFAVAANGNLTITPSGSAIVDSSLTINGNTVLGDNSADTLTIAGTAVTCNNGLNFDSNTLFISSSNNRVGIGTITPAAPLDVFSSTTTQMRLSYDAANAVDFQVNNGGNLTIDPTGNSLTLKGDLIIKDGSEPTKTIVQIFDNQDDGLIGGYAGGSTLNFLLHGNGTSYFKNNFALGQTTTAETLGISGSFAVSGSSVRARLANSIFEISSSTTIQSGGQALFEVKSPTNPNLFGISEGGVVASNIQPAAFNANLYISGAAVIGAPTAVVPDANLHSGSLTFYLDEGNNKLKFKVRYSTGVIKNGEINLT